MLATLIVSGINCSGGADKKPVWYSHPPPRQGERLRDVITKCGLSTETVVTCEFAAGAPVDKQKRRNEHFAECMDMTIEQVESAWSCMEPLNGCSELHSCLGGEEIRTVFIPAGRQIGPTPGPTFDAISDDDG